MLIKILKAAKAELIDEIINSLASINGINTTITHIQKLLRSFIKKPKNLLHIQVKDYTHALLKVLVNSITKKSRSSFYSFKGNSYILLNRPICTFNKGLCWTGYIHPEKTTESKQCIISFMSHYENNVKGFEIYLKRRKLTYSTVNTQGGYKRMTYSTGEVPMNQWSHIVFSHVGNELVIFINKVQYVMDVPSQMLPKEYNVGMIGANMDYKTMYPCDYFIGEMSILYFYHPTALFLASIKDIVLKDKYLPLLYDHGDRLEGFSASKGNMKFMSKEFLNTTLFILDPKVFYNYI